MPALPLTPPAKAAPPPGRPPRSAGPPPATGPGDFAALLDQTSARTAPAEGPKTRPGQPATALRRDDHVDRGRDGEAHAATAARKAARDADADAGQPVDAPDAPAPDAAACAPQDAPPADPTGQENPAATPP